MSKRTGKKPAAERPGRTRPAPSGKPAVHPSNTLNDLTGAEWLYWSRSLIDKPYPHEFSHVLRKRHGGNKPPRLMADLIRLFTKPGDLVLDPFAGAGGTLIGAAITGRRALGIEINPEWIGLYGKVCEENGLERFPVLEGDARKVLAGLLEERGEGFAAFAATDPPYGLQFERTMCVPEKESRAAKHSLRRSDFGAYSSDGGDLSNAESFEAYFEALRTVVGLLGRAVKPGGYAAVILRNAYQDGRFINVAARAASDAEKSGWVQKGEFIWYVPGTRLRPYGYPKAFVPNIAHQNIIVLRREA